MQGVNWNWSFKAFRLFGVDVHVHWSLLAYFLYYVMRGAKLGVSLTTLGLFVILPMVLLFASVVAHEYGHVFAARYCRLRVGHMILTPIGGAVMVAQGNTPGEETLVAAAGPSVNLGLAIAASALYFALGGVAGLELYVPFAGNELFYQVYGTSIPQAILFDFINSQMAMFLFNMLCVAYPLDGGRVLHAFLWRRRGFHNAMLLTCKIARVMAVILGLVGVVTMNFMLILIAFFIFMQASMTMKQVHLMPDPGGYYGIRPQAKNAPGKKKKPSFVRAWLDERKERRLRALLARAETKGIASLTAAERAWLKKARESRMN